MAFGAKTNERPGTRATARFIRVAPNKVREVLNLIRGKSVAEAEDILALVRRDAAADVVKVLNSAVANAEANDEQDPERLYVSACYADEGPTLKRFRPRARGRATTIRRRTSHITVIVSRLSDAEYERLTAGKAESAGGDRRRRVSASRAERVAKSRAKDAEKAGLADDEAVDEVDETADEVEAAPTDETTPDATDETVEATGDVTEATDGAAEDGTAAEAEPDEADEDESTDTADAGDEEDAD